MSAATSIALPLVQAFHPATFLERGVAVPFTTPQLAGVRARPAERGGIEFIVPNPSGGRGVYILGWQGVRQICRPTVHDMRLNAHLAALPAVTPAALRRAAQEVADEGLAGREAQAAAAAARAAEGHDRLVTNFLLLLALVGQMEPAGLGDLAAGQGSSAELEQRARRSVAWIAPRLGRPAEAIGAALEELAAVFAGIGLPGQAPPPRIARLLAGLRRLQQELGPWVLRTEVEAAARASLVAAAAALTLTCAAQTLSEAQAMTADMAEALRRWTDTPGRVAELVARPEWLLDGWEPICLLWTAAGTDAERAAALEEMAALVPVLPRETSEWIGMAVETEGVLAYRKNVPLNHDWRTGTLFERVARNERLRALAA